MASLGLAGGAAAHGGVSGGKPQLRLVDKRPVTVQGSGFKPLERVTLVASAQGSSWERRLAATAAGRFFVSFRSRSIDGCASYEITARGSRGSRTALRSLDLKECPEAVFP